MHFNSEWEPVSVCGYKCIKIDGEWHVRKSPNAPDKILRRKFIIAFCESYGLNTYRPRKWSEKNLKHELCLDKEVRWDYFSHFKCFDHTRVPWKSCPVYKTLDFHNILVDELEDDDKSQ